MPDEAPHPDNLRPLNKLIPPGGVSLDEFCERALVLAATLAAVHEQRLAFTDFTSADVLVPAGGDLTVMQIKRAETLPVAGDPAEMVGANIAAWGLIGCELLVGPKAHSEATARTLHRLALREDPDCICRWRPEVPVEISRLISQCVLGTSPAGAGAMFEIARVLREIQARLYTGELTYLPLSPEAAQSRKSVVNWTLVLVLLNLLFAVIAFFYWKR